MTALFSRINPCEIIKCHFLTFHNDRTERLDLIEVAAVIFAPILTAFYLCYTSHIISAELAKSLFTVYAILGGFFVNALVLLANRKDSLDNGGEYRSKASLIKETYHNIAFGVLVSFSNVVISAIYQFLGTEDSISFHFFAVKQQMLFSFIIYSLSFYFLHTLFMVIKRLNRLFSDYISS